LHSRMRHSKACLGVEEAYASRMRGRWALIAGSLTIALSGCGSGAKTPTIPLVEHASPRFAKQMDRICAHSTAALIRWGKSSSRDSTFPYRTLVREKESLRRLRPPSGERQAFGVFLATFQRLIDAWRGLIDAPLDKQEFSALVKTMEPDGRMATALARRLGAKTCALQASGNGR
jgi:hypothetical protein